MFNKSPLTAPRLQKCLAFLRTRGAAGATTLEINETCSTTRASSDISELRANGVAIDTIYEGRTEDGRRRHRYFPIET